MASIKTEATNGLVIKQVNVSNAIQIIVTKFTVTVVRLPLTYLIFKHFNIKHFEVILISTVIALQTFHSKYLNAFKPNFVVLTVFLDNIYL